MTLDFHGTQVTVPKRYATYPRRSKELIARTVVDLQRQYGEGLQSVHITRVCKRRTGLTVYFDISCLVRESFADAVSWEGS